MSLDAVVIGAGVNGLVAAHALANAGKRVMVLERQAAAGGALDAGWIPPAVRGGLSLERQGLTITRPDPWIAVPLPAGGRLELFQDAGRSAEAIRTVSPRDAAKWPEFCRRMHALACVFADLYAAAAPDIECKEPGELLRLALTGLRVRRMGRRGMIDLLRILPMPVADLLDEWFETDALKAVLAAGATAHLRQGPRSGGTAFTFLHHHVGNPPGVFRPALSNIGQVLGAKPGPEIRRGAEAARVLIKDGVAVGVVLRNGEEIGAPVVLSSADPRRTMLGLVDAQWLDPAYVRAVGNIKCRGVVARVTFTSGANPGFTSLAVAPSMAYVERAYDDAKYGRVSRHPFLEAYADDGRVVAHVQHAPYALADGDWDEVRRGALGEAVLDALSEHAPSIRAAVTGREVLTPRDLEERYGVTEGNLYHGELTLDQILFMRPVPGWSRYRTPIRGLYLCGAGTHPGGAIAGGSGWLAVREVLG